MTVTWSDIDRADQARTVLYSLSELDLAAGEVVSRLGGPPWVRRALCAAPVTNSARKASPAQRRIYDEELE